MKITTLVENLVYQKGLLAEHGLSFYFEADGKKILMDVGQSDVFYHNARVLKIDIADIDFLIISHGHYDHTGGLADFLKINSKAKIILKQEALFDKMNGERNIGIPKNVTFDAARCIFVNDIFSVTQSVVVFPKITEQFSVDSHKKGFSVKQNDITGPDNFDDELFVCLLYNNEVSIISSCSHNGISNIAMQVSDTFQRPINTILGGYHIKDAKKHVAMHIINTFNKLKVKNVGFSHCSGIHHFGRFQMNCKANVFYNYTGNVVDLDNPL